MRLHRGAALLAAGALAGCGSDSADDQASQRPEADTQARTQPKPKGPTDAVQVRKLVLRYTNAVGERDWRAVCATLTPGARERLARKAGSCPKSYRTTPREASRYSKELLPNKVRINGDRATVTATPYGVGPDDRPEDKYYAAKINGRWWLVIKRAAGGAP